MIRKNDRFIQIIFKAVSLCSIGTEPFAIWSWLVPHCAMLEISWTSRRLFFLLGCQWRHRRRQPRRRSCETSLRRGWMGQNERERPRTLALPVRLRRSNRQSIQNFNLVDQIENSLRKAMQNQIHRSKPTFYITHLATMISFCSHLKCSTQYFEISMLYQIDLRCIGYLLLLSYLYVRYVIDSA